MGQKTNPIGFRIGVSRTWSSRWFAKKDYAKLLHEDIKLRKHLKEKLFSAGISKIEIERTANKVTVNVFSSRPGLIIGKKGSGIDQLRNEVQRLTKNELVLNVLEVRKPEIDATLVAENIANQLERRIAFRRAMKKAMATATGIHHQSRLSSSHNVARRKRPLGLSTSADGTMILNPICPPLSL